MYDWRSISIANRAKRNSCSDFVPIWSNFASISGLFGPFPEINHSRYGLEGRYPTM